MSGLCAILRLDGAPPAGITAMAQRLERRGPEGTHLFRDGPVALGHTLLGTTPEALVERLPLTHAPTGCAITADVRLDNRDDLLAAFGLAQVGRVVGDGELIVQAWLRWGEACPVHLLGDFAFAIWDPRRRALFCARDQLGMKQLIWHHSPGRLFACASEPQAVLLARGVPRRMDEGRVGDVLEGRLEGVDLTSTFFDGVSRLPPAHSLTVTGAGAAMAQYWQPQPGPRLSIGLPEAAEALREVLDRAVRRRLRAPEGRLGAMLSGGIDSGAVAALAARALQDQGRRLPTYSAIGPDPATCPETRTIRLAQAHLPVDARSVDWAALGPLGARLVQAEEDLDDPFDAVMTMIRAIYLTAAADGRCVVLDGGAGDITLGVPMRLPYLLMQGRLWSAWREVRGEAAFYGGGWTERHVLRTALAELLPVRVRAWLSRARRAARGERWPATITPDFAARIGLDDRVLRQMRQDRLFSLSHATDRARALAGTVTVAGRERYDRVAAALGIEPRDPFLDRDVIDLALRLPAACLQSGGIRKLALRDCVADLLPPEVRYRRGKEHLGAEFHRAVLALAAQSGAATGADTEGRGGGDCLSGLLQAGLPTAQGVNIRRSMRSGVTRWLVPDSGEPNLER